MILVMDNNQIVLDFEGEKLLCLLPDNMGVGTAFEKGIHVIRNGQFLLPKNEATRKLMLKRYNKRQPKGE